MTTTAKAPRARPKKRKSPELIRAESICRTAGRDVVDAGLIERQGAEIAELRAQIERVQRQRDGAVEDMNRLRAELLRLVVQLAAMIRRASGEITPRLRDGLLADLERELRDAGVRDA